MRVFLIQAARYAPETERSMPLGPMYLASYLRERHGCDVGMFDMQLKVRDSRPAVEKALAFRPDLIGVSGMTPDAPSLERLSRELRKALPGVPVVMGGAHVTNYPFETMDRWPVDYVVTHEGETSLGALVQVLSGEGDLENVPNLLWRDAGGVRRNAKNAWIDDLDGLPFPAYDLVDLERYYEIGRCGIIYAHRRYAALVTSRGCPYHCAYCHTTLGKKWRKRTPENIVDEMERLMRDYDVGDFVVMDDLFNADARRVNAFAREIIRRKLKVGLSFPIGLRGDIMTEESVLLLKEAGMYRCMYAVESASNRIQDLIRKHNKLEKIRHIIDFTRNQGVMVHASFMLGFPTETETEARSTVDFAVRSKLHTAAFYRVIPFKGTDLHDIVQSVGKDPGDDLETMEFHQANVVNVSEIPDDVINRLKRTAYRRFYLSPARIWSLLRILPNRRHLLPQLFGMWVRKALVW